MRRYHNMSDRQVERFGVPKYEMGSRNGQRIPAYLIHQLLRDGGVIIESRFYENPETRDDKLHRHIPKGKVKKR